MKEEDLRLHLLHYLTVSYMNTGIKEFKKMMMQTVTEKSFKKILKKYNKLFKALESHEN